MTSESDVFLSSGLRRLADPSKSISDYSLLATLARRWNVFLAANFKRRRLPRPQEISEEDDLYREFPPEVRTIHSLHFLGPEDMEGWLELVEALRSCGGLVLVFTANRRKELLTGLRLYLGWYAEPQVLRLQFEEGSQHLAIRLMTGVQAILIVPSLDEGWRLYMPPDAEFNWEDIEK